MPSWENVLGYIMDANDLILVSMVSLGDLQVMVDMSIGELHKILMKVNAKNHK